MRLRFCLALLAFPALSSADPLLSPQEALKKMTVPEGFSVDLIAAEPDIVQPIAFCWDARGRIWVVEGNTYPSRRNNRPPGGDSSTPGEAQLKDIYGGEDRILIFSDENGDGTFETRKVFAEKLHLVSGIEVGFGGVYVGAAPYLLHIPDKDGDDKPDGAPEILLDGWGWQDTHETLNTFSWGPDGWLYGCHGVFTHSNVGAPGTPKEKRTPLNCAYWRFHPVRKSFEIFASGTSNSWGFDYNEEGEWFSEACVIPHFWHIIQGGYYLRQSNPLGHFNPYVYTNIETIADHLHYIGNTPHSGNNVSDAAGGGHAHCGLLIYNGDNFPEEYRGRAMLFNIHGKRINQQILERKGSGYVAKAAPDFLKANDANFTGVALKVGPDGAVYFIDWYDREKCHRPQPEVWDRSNGRLYRVKYDKTWKPWRGDVGKMTDGELSRLRSHPNEWFARTARRLMQEKQPRASLLEYFRSVAGSIDMGEFNVENAEPSEVFSYWVKKTRNLDPKGTGVGLIYQPAADASVAFTLSSRNGSALEVLEKLCARGGLELTAGEGSPQPVVAPVSEETKRLRAAVNLPGEKFRALAVIATTEPFQDTAGLSVLKNADDRVRARGIQMLTRFDEALPALAVNDNSPRVRLALASLLQRLPLSDRWQIAEALIQHGEDIDDHNLPQMYWYAIEPLVPADPGRALDLAEKSKIPLISQHIARRLAETDGGVPHLIKALGKEKTASGTVYLLKAALQGLKGRHGEKAPPGWDGAWNNIDDVLKRRTDAKENAAEINDLREALAVAFGDTRAFPRLREQVKDATLPPERRELALQTLLDGKDPEIPSLILVLLDDPVLRLAALKALPRATK